MLPTIVRCRVRSTHNSTTCPSSSTAIRDSCLAALMTISRDIRFSYSILTLASLTQDEVQMTIYFAGAISGGRSDVALYREIISALEAAGHHVLAGAVATEHVTASGEALDSCAIFDRDVAWIAAVDVL